MNDSALTTAPQKPLPHLQQLLNEYRGQVEILKKANCNLLSIVYRIKIKDGEEPELVDSKIDTAPMDYVEEMEDINGNFGTENNKLASIITYLEKLI